MLQQTQTSRVVDKYIQFTRAFPTFAALANAPLGDVLLKWQGLGYNRRAISLKKIAEHVTNTLKGELPQDIVALDDLPGIGYATACSIRAFAWNLPAPFIETNIRRVYIHFFFSNLKKVNDQTILPLVAKTLNTEKTREWYYALMDYGAYLKSIVPNPNRKSAHYTKQSVFVGSNREVRGAILKLMTSKKIITRVELLKLLPFEKNKVEKNLLDLTKEGFLTTKAKKIILAA